MALDRISMAQWMDEHHWVSPRLRWYVEFACRDDYGMRLSDTECLGRRFLLRVARRRAMEETSRRYLARETAAWSRTSENPHVSTPSGW
jgi:hypothetical protein